MAYRRWCFTWHADENDEWPEDRDQQLIENTKFVCFQEERGAEDGKLHLQGYAEFDRKMRLTALKKAMCTRISWRSCKGTQEQNIAYCTKEDTRVNGPWEFGERARPGTRTDIAALKNVLDEGGSIRDVAEQDFEAFLKYHKGLDRYKREITPRRNWEMEVLVYWGAPGTGKTRKAFEDNPDAYFKPTGDWWDGYEGQECVIIDDFYGNMPWTFLLQLLDRYPLLVPYKGGFHQFTSKRIIFTSNVDVSEWYDFAMKPKMKLDALLRRITHKTHFN